jgi:hypothetical protein
MVPTLFLVTALALGEPLTSGQDAPPVKTPHPPLVGYARVIGSGDIQIVHAFAKPVWETHTKQEVYTVEKNANGQIVPEQRVRTRTYQVKKYVTEQRVITAAARDFRVQRDGKPVGQSGLFEDWTPVAFTDIGTTLDPFYTQFLREGTFVVYLRSDATRPDAAQAPVAPKPAPSAPAASPAPAPIAPSAPAPAAPAQGR